MKTIETNLIGDLKQKYSAAKISALATPISDSTQGSKEQKNTLILFGVAGSGIILLIIGVLALIASFVAGFFIDGHISKLEKDKLEQESELARCTKILEDLNTEKLDLIIKNKIKDYFVSHNINSAELLEEIRAKLPKDVTLLNVVKNKSGLLIKGFVSSHKKNPLEIISYFVVNLNRDRTDNSYIYNAILASVSVDESFVNFSIKADANTKVAREELKSKNAGTAK